MFSLQNHWSYHLLFLRFLKMRCHISDERSHLIQMTHREKERSVEIRAIYSPQKRCISTIPRLDDLEFIAVELTNPFSSVTFLGGLCGVSYISTYVVENRSCAPCTAKCIPSLWETRSTPMNEEEPVSHAIVKPVLAKLIGVDNKFDRIRAIRDGSVTK